MLALMNMIEVRPWITGRSRGESRSAMMVCAIGKRPPPPIPCRPRAMTNTQKVGASAQATEPATKMPIAIIRMERRP